MALQIFIFLTILFSSPSIVFSGILSNSAVGGNLSVGNMGAPKLNLPHSPLNAFGGPSNLALPSSINYGTAASFSGANLVANGGQRIEPIYSMKNKGGNIESEGEDGDWANISSREEFGEKFEQKMKEIYPKCEDYLTWEYWDKYSGKTYKMGAQVMDLGNIKLMAKLFGHYLFNNILNKNSAKILKESKTRNEFFENALKLLKALHQCNRLGQHKIVSNMGHINEILEMRKGDATKLTEHMAHDRLEEDIRMTLDIEGIGGQEEMAKKADEIVEMISSMRTYASRIADDFGVRYFSRDKSHEEAVEMVKRIEEGFKVIDQANQILKIWEYFQVDRPLNMAALNISPLASEERKKIMKELKDEFGKEMAKNEKKEFIFMGTGELEKNETQKLDGKNLDLVAELVENYEYYGDVREMETKTTKRRREKFDREKMKNAVLLLKGVHVADRVSKYNLAVENVERQIKALGDVDKLGEKMDLYYLKENLWAPLGVKKFEDNFEKKADKLIGDILAPNQFAAQLARDFRIKYNENKLGERAENILQRLKRGYTVVERIVKILEACGNFRDEAVWERKNILGKQMIVPPALLQPKMLSEKEAREIIAEEKEREEE